MGNLGLVEADYEWVTSNSCRWPTATAKAASFPAWRAATCSAPGPQRGCPRQGPDRRRLTLMDKHFLDPPVRPLPNPSLSLPALDEPEQQTPNRPDLHPAMRAQRFTGSSHVSRHPHQRHPGRPGADPRPTWPSLRCPEDVAAALELAGRASAAPRWSFPAASTPTGQCSTRWHDRDGMYLLGPNCLGFQRPPCSSMPAWPARWRAGAAGAGVAVGRADLVHPGLGAATTPWAFRPWSRWAPTRRSTWRRCWTFLANDGRRTASWSTWKASPTRAAS
jgi:hypothetical protein